MERRIVSFLSNLFLWSSTIWFTITFMVAYLNETKSVVIEINKYNEAGFELICIIFLWLMLIIYTFCKVENERRQRTGA